MRIRSLARTWGLVVAGVLVGTLLLGPASAHFPGDLKHGKKHFITKKTANKKFQTRQAAASLVPRVASSFVASPPSGGSQNFQLAATSITAPTPGYLVIDGISNIDDGTSTNDWGSCLLMLGATDLNAEYNWTVDDVEAEQQTCVSHTVTPVTAGSHTVSFHVSGLATTSQAYDARVTALFVPFGGTGTGP